MGILGLASTDQGHSQCHAANVNDPPSIDSTPVTAATDNQAYAHDMVAGDPDAGDALTIMAAAPGWLSITDNGDGTALP